MLQSLIFNGDILILMQQIINLEFQLRKPNIFATKLIFQFDQFILKFNPKFPLIIKIMF